jgi:hypothetical protein
VIELTKHWATFRGSTGASLSLRARQKSAVFGPKTGRCHPLFGVGGNLHCQEADSRIILCRITKPKGASSRQRWQHRRLATDSLAAQRPEVERPAEA